MWDINKENRRSEVGEPAGTTTCDAVAVIPISRFHCNFLLTVCTSPWITQFLTVQYYDVFCKRIIFAIYLIFFQFITLLGIYWFKSCQKKKNTNIYTALTGNSCFQITYSVIVSRRRYILTCIILHDIYMAGWSLSLTCAGTELPKMFYHNIVND